MDNQNSSNSANNAGWWNKYSYAKHVAIFFGVLLIVGGGYFVWGNYFSTNARLARQQQAQYEKYAAWENDFNKIMTEDNYGGKTPEETLKMFVDALKQGDTDLAAKYFYLETDTKDPNFMTRNKWIEGLKAAKEDGALPGIIEIVEKAKFDSKSSWAESAWFSVLNKDGIADYTIILKLNTFSNTWKIESM